MGETVVDLQFYLIVLTNTEELHGLKVTVCPVNIPLTPPHVVAVFPEVEDVGVPEVVVYHRVVWQ